MVDSTVFVIDDDEAVRDALCELFASENIPVRAFASAEEFLASDSVGSPGCLILDLMMPGMSGVDLQAELVHRGATIPIIIMTGQGDVPKAVTTLKAGAFDFIEKPFDPTALMKVVNQALNREGRLRRRYAEREAIESRLSLLSPRERQVMDLVVAGHSNKVIGTKLGISVRTVENHRAKLMDKMRCNNVSSLITTILQLKSPAA